MCHFRNKLLKMVKMIVGKLKYSTYDFISVHVDFFKYLKIQKSTIKIIYLFIQYVGRLAIIAYYFSRISV